MNIRELFDKGFSYSPETRTKGPINVLKFVNNRIVGVGDALPIKFYPRGTSTKLVGGIRQRIKLPTDRKIVGMPVVNTQNTKDLIAAVKRQIRESRASHTPIVKLPFTFNGLDYAQTPNIRAKRFAWDTAAIRGGILVNQQGPVRKRSLMYRQTVMPTSPVVFTQPDESRVSGEGPQSVENRAPVSVRISTLKDNTQVLVDNATVERSTEINPTLFFVGALVLAFLVLRK